MEKKRENTSQGNISRRDFNKLVLAAAASLVLPAGCATGSTGSETGGIKDPEIVLSPEVQLKPTVLVLDFFDIDGAKERFIQEDFPSDFSETQALAEMGITDPVTPEGLKEGVPQTEEQKRALMLNILHFHFKDHGDRSIDGLKKTGSFLAANQEAFIPVQQSITEAIIFGEIESDTAGNLTAHVEIDSEFVERQVAGSDESVVNMSFEMGKIKLAYALYKEVAKYPELRDQMPSKVNAESSTFYKDYQGNYITEEEYNELIEKIDEKVAVLREPADRVFDLIDAYSDENTAENVLKLVQIAKKFPDKMFIAAGGNPSRIDGMGGLRIPDIAAIRRELEAKGEWPENLIVVGFEGTYLGEVSNASLGADIYVSYKDLDRFGLPIASSFATPIVTEAVRQVIVKGLNTPSEVKEWLMEMTDSKTTLFPYNQEHEYRVLNLEKVKESLTLLEGKFF